MMRDKNRVRLPLKVLAGLAARQFFLIGVSVNVREKRLVERAVFRLERLRYVRAPDRQNDGLGSAIHLVHSTSSRPAPAALRALPGSPFPA